MYYQDTEILQLLSEGLIREKRDFFMKEMERMTFICTKKHEANTDNSPMKAYPQKLSCN